MFENLRKLSICGMLREYCSGTNLSATGISDCASESGELWLACVGGPPRHASGVRGRTGAEAPTSGAPLILSAPPIARFVSRLSETHTGGYPRQIHVIMNPLDKISLAAQADTGAEPGRGGRSYGLNFRIWLASSCPFKS